MGQYYNILIKKDDKYILYNRSFRKTDGSAEYEPAKLTEHSFIGNTTMSCVSNLILRKPKKVAWVGDYSNQYEENEKVNNLDYNQMKELHDLEWKHELRANILPFKPLLVNFLLLVNWDKKQYIDMCDYIEKSTVKEGYLQGMCLHPLSLLTALGNGFGGGDYHGTNEELVGSWCLDTISFESIDIENKLIKKGFKALDVIFLEK